MATGTSGAWRRLPAPLRWLAVLGRDSGVRRGFWALAMVLLTAAIYSSVSLPHEVNLRVGEVAPYTITAPRDMVDQPATQRRQQAAVAQVPPVYSTDPGLTERALAAYDGAVAVIADARQNLRRPPPAASGAAKPSSSQAHPQAQASAVQGGGARPAASAGRPATSAASRLASQVAALRQNLNLALPTADYQAVLLSASAAQSAAEAGARRELQALLDAGVRKSDLQAARARLQGEVAALPAPPAVARFLAALAGQSLLANRGVSVAETKAARQQASAGVTPVLYARGQVIVRKGDVVTAANIVNLRNAGLLHPGGTAGLLGASLLWAILLLVLCWAYLAQFHPRALRDEVHLVLFGAILVAALAASRFGLEISPYLAPVAWAAILASSAYGPAVALFVAAVGAVAVGVLDHNLGVTVAAAAGSWAAVFSLRRLVQRTDLLRAGLFSALAGAGATALLAGLLLGGGGLSVGGGALAASGPSGPLLRDVAAAAVTGLLSAVLAIGTLPLAEAFGVLTPFRLLELANPSQPLLRRLMTEAPGTYHHSLMVANLSEAACEAVGGDALLVRAGAYYHDIGKMKRPAFFVENQMGGQNPHDKLSPQLSALVITSHVRDGAEMARQARLPGELVDFIRTHHGTTLVRYFYHAAQTAQAAQAADGAGGGAAAAPAVAEEDFRYEGPIPESRETAIVMLADGVEAAVRALRQPTAERIEDVIRRIVADRLEDGQLEHASLTLRDVDAIRTTFRRLLVGAYHARLEYPEHLAAEVGVARAVPAGGRGPGGPG